MKTPRGAADSPEQFDPDWAHYPNTILLFESDGRYPGRLRRIDLRAPVSGRDIALLETLGLSEPFAVMTAHDPHGRDLHDEANAAREARLREMLTERGAWFVEVDACSPDRAHCERSVAVTLPFNDAVEIAKSFGQVAFFWFDGEKFWIAGALADTDPVVLPRAP